MLLRFSEKLVGTWKQILQRVLINLVEPLTCNIHGSHMHGSPYMVHTYMAHSSWFMFHGSHIHGSWFMVYGSHIHSSWYMVHYINSYIYSCYLKSRKQIVKIDNTYNPYTTYKDCTSQSCILFNICIIHLTWVAGCKLCLEEQINHRERRYGMNNTERT